VIKRALIRKTLHEAQSAYQRANDDMGTLEEEYYGFTNPK
jgi:hypothetical protein